MHNALGVFAMAADDNAIGVHKIGDRITFLQKLWVTGNLKYRRNTFRG